MSRFVEFKEIDGELIFINPLQVTEVRFYSPEASQVNFAIKKAEKTEYRIVLGAVRDVVNLLDAGLQGT